MSQWIRSSCVLLLVCSLSSSPQAQSPQAPDKPGAPAISIESPLTLEQVLALAEARSETVGVARSGIERARGEQLRARSGLFPQLTASASYDRALASEFSSVFGSGDGAPSCPPFTLNPGAALDERVAEIERAIDCGAIGGSFFGGGSDDEEIDLPFGRKNTWRVNLVFSQNVYSGGRIGAQTAIAAVGRDSADLALSSARAQLLYDATRAFYDAALSEQLVRIAEATLAQAEATVAQVQSGFEAGAQPEFELLRARVSRDNQRPAVIRGRAARDVALLRLKQLLDIPADAPLQIIAPLDGSVVEPPPAFAGRLPAAGPELPAIESRTAVREAAAAVRLREATLRLTEAERRPSVTVTSNYTQVAYPSDFFPTGDFRTNWTVGANLQFPILTGGRQRGSEIVSRADVQSAQLQLQQIRELAQLDVESALAELTAARAAFDASAGTIEQAQRAYEIAEVRFRAGVSTQLELTDARLLLQQAEANRAQAARDLQVARARVALLPDLPLGAASATGAGAGQAPAAAAGPPAPVNISGGANQQGGGGRE